MMHTLLAGQTGHVWLSLENVGNSLNFSESRFTVMPAPTAWERSYQQGIARWELPLLPSCWPGFPAHGLAILNHQPAPDAC